MVEWISTRLVRLQPPVPAVLTLSQEFPPSVVDKTRTGQPHKVGEANPHLPPNDSDK